jgi:hypothetical protein
VNCSEACFDWREGTTFAICSLFSTNDQTHPASREIRVKLSIIHSLPALGVHWHHLFVSFFPPPHSYRLLCFNMSGPTVFQGARNVVVSGTVTAANTVREWVFTFLFTDLKLTGVDLLQINYNFSNRTMSDTVIPLKPNSSTRFTGHTEIIAKLRDHFTSPSDGLRARKYFLLHRMGGIGKTQICLRFFEEMFDQSVPQHLLSLIAE